VLVKVVSTENNWFNESSNFRRAPRHRLEELLHNARAVIPELPQILNVPQTMGNSNIRLPLLEILANAYLTGSSLDVAKMCDGPSSTCS
jgi:hypothetical protein